VGRLLTLLHALPILAPAARVCADFYTTTPTRIRKFIHNREWLSTEDWHLSTSLCLCDASTRTGTGLLLPFFALVVIEIERVDELAER
jgi:hypothetical protein